MRDGLFLCFEGTEGSGKSTLIRLLKEKLEQLGRQVVCTREPGGHPVSEKLRQIVLNEDVNAWTEVFVYEAARAEHVARLIAPALKAKKIVLCDRFTASTLAYQSTARGLPWKEIEKLNQLAIQKTKPDLIFWLDIDVEKGLKRATDPNRFEREGILFQKKVWKGYAKAFMLSPRQWCRLKLKNETPEEICGLVLGELKKRKWLKA